MYLTLNKKISWNCFTFFSVRNHRIIIAKLQIEHDNKFSSVAEAKSYTGFIFKGLRARWLHVIRDFFYQFQFESSHHYYHRGHHHQHLHHCQHHIVTIIKRILFIILRRTISAFSYPVKNIILRPGWPQRDISVLSYYHQYPQTDRQVRSRRWSHRPLLLLWCVSYNRKFSLADPYIHR